MTTSWAGIENNERAFNRVRNALVEVFLHGVQGVSTPVQGREHQLVPYADAQRYIQKGKETLTFLETQRVPRIARARTWMKNHIADLRRLLTNAREVAAGSKPPKMRAAEYEAYDTSLGITPIQRARIEAERRGELGLGSPMFTSGSQKFSDPLRGRVNRISGPHKTKIFATEVERALMRYHGLSHEEAARLVYIHSGAVSNYAHDTIRRTPKEVAGYLVQY